MKKPTKRFDTTSPQGRRHPAAQPKRSNKNCMFGNCRTYSSYWTVLVGPLAVYLPRFSPTTIFREAPMKRCLVLVSFIVLALCVAPAFAQQKATATNVPEISYTSLPNFLKLPPGEYLGEAVAVATN